MIVSVNWNASNSEATPMLCSVCRFTCICNSGLIQTSKKTYTSNYSLPRNTSKKLVLRTTFCLEIGYTAIAPHTFVGRNRCSDQLFLVDVSIYADCTHRSNLGRACMGSNCVILLLTAFKLHFSRWREHPVVSRCDWNSRAWPPRFCEATQFRRPVMGHLPLHSEHVTACSACVLGVNLSCRYLVVCLVLA